MLISSNPRNSDTKSFDEVNRRLQKAEAIAIVYNFVRPMPLKAGDPAPEFELPAVAGENQVTVRSRDYLGKQNLVVTFHPLDWTPT